MSDSIRSGEHSIDTAQADVLPGTFSQARKALLCYFVFGGLVMKLSEICEAAEHHEDRKLEAICEAVVAATVDRIARRQEYEPTLPRLDYYETLADEAKLAGLSIEA